MASPEPERELLQSIEGTVSQREESESDEESEQEGNAALDELSRLNARYAEDAAALLRRCKKDTEVVQRKQQEILHKKEEDAARIAALTEELLETVQERMQLPLSCPGDTASGLEAFLRFWKEQQPTESATELTQKLYAQVEEERLRYQLATEEFSKEKAALSEARATKTKEEVQCEAFKHVRLKDAEIQELKRRVAEEEWDVEKAQKANAESESFLAQKEAEVVKTKNEVVQLKYELEEQVGELKFLAEENQQLRLEFDEDACFRPWKEETRAEVEILRSELEEVLAKLPHTRPIDSLLPWIHLARDSIARRHATDAFRFQQQRKAYVSSTWISPVDGGIQSDGSEMKRREELYFNEESNLQRSFEIEKENIVKERDEKVAQLLAAVEKKFTGNAQKQTLLKQAKLFAQRLDAKITRRAEEFLKRKRHFYEVFLKDKRGLAKSHRDETTFTDMLDRFEEGAKTRLQSLEEEYFRTIDRETQVSPSVLKYATPYDFTCHLDVKKDPVSLSWIEDACVKMLDQRVQLRSKLKKEMENNSLLQLRATHEDFRVKECKRQSKGVFVGSRIVSLLHFRQQRVSRDLCKRQFFDYLLLLRFCQVAAQDLLFLDKIPDYPAPGCESDETGNALVKLIHIARRVCMELHKAEFRAILREGIKEVRTAVQSLCQNEPDLVDEIMSEELNLMSLNLRYNLLAERTDEIREMQKLQEEEVEEEVDRRLGCFVRDILSEERETLEARKTFLEDKCQDERMKNEEESVLCRSYKNELQLVHRKLDTMIDNPSHVTDNPSHVTDEPLTDTFDDDCEPDFDCFRGSSRSPSPENTTPKLSPTTLSVMMREHAQQQRKLIVQAEQVVPHPPRKPSRGNPRRRCKPMKLQSGKVPRDEYLCEWPFEIMSDSSTADDDERWSKTTCTTLSETPDDRERTGSKGDFVVDMGMEDLVSIELPVY